MAGGGGGAGRDVGRYLEADGDGIPWRRYPGTHAERCAFFTRGTSKDRYAKYSEEGATYVDNMQRLLKKFETAKQILPRPIARRAKEATRFGPIYYGSTPPALGEALPQPSAPRLHC